MWLLSSFFAKMIFFASASQAVAVADRYPQNVFAEHTHEFCELVLVWRGNGLHVLNDRPYRITRGDLFYIRAEDKHSYASVNDLVLQNVIYCPDRLKLNVDWAGNIPGFHDARGEPHWRLSSNGMAQVRQTISQLEQESQKSDPVANQMSELLFAQLVMTLKRHRYATDNPSATMQEALLDKLITRLAGSLNKSFVLEKFCEQEQCSERALRQQFRTQTGMTVNHYLRQLRICHAQYLLQHTELMVSEVAMRCGFEDSNYFSVVFNREGGDDAGSVASSQSKRQRNQFAMPRPTILAAMIITTQPEAQHANRTTPGVVPLFQHQPNQPAAQHVEAHVQHPAHVVILRRNTGVTPRRRRRIADTTSGRQGRRAGRW